MKFSHLAGAALAVLLIVSATCSLNWRQAKFSVKLVDEDGHPIPHVKMRASLDQSVRFGDRLSRTIDRMTDRNGLVEFQGVSTGGWGFGLYEEGYYYSGSGPVSPTGKSFGRWEPWGVQHILVGKKIGKPIPLYARFTGDLAIPVRGVPVGFDLIACDWVAPHGKGTSSDFIFTLFGEFESIEKPYWTTLTLSFPNAQDGIIEVPKSVGGGSDFRMPRKAPADGYVGSLHALGYFDGRTRVSGFGESWGYMPWGYMFRVRSQESEGRVTKANYGKLHGPIEFFPRSNSIRFRYFLNPTPGDTNLEFDSKRNLFPGIEKTLYGISGP